MRVLSPGLRVFKPAHSRCRLRLLAHRTWLGANLEWLRWAIGPPLVSDGGRWTAPCQAIVKLLIQRQRNGRAQCPLHCPDCPGSLAALAALAALAGALPCRGPNPSPLKLSAHIHASHRRPPSLSRDRDDRIRFHSPAIGIRPAQRRCHRVDQPPINRPLDTSRRE